MTTPVCRIHKRREHWKPVPGCSGYESSDKGRFRSVDREVSGRSYPGQLLATGISNRGYVKVNLRTDDGRQVTRNAHTVLLETWVGPRPPGMEACHGDDNPLHNCIENLRWDWPPANRDDRSRNHPPALKPERRCVRCGGPVAGNGRRCHDCVEAIGQEAAVLMRHGTTLAKAAETLGYPTLDGLHTLAVRYGSYGHCPPRCPCRRSQGVTATVRDLLRPGDRP